MSHAEANAGAGQPRADGSVDGPCGEGSVDGPCAAGSAFANRLEAEKLAALAEFAAGAGHEINNPLAVISGRAQLLLARETDPERRRELATIHRQALRVREMISDLMHFARPAQPRFALVGVRELIAQVVERLALRAADAQLRIGVTLPDDVLTVWADRTQLSVALSAVIENALDALAHVAIFPNGAKGTPISASAESPPAAAGERTPEIRVSAAIRQEMGQPSAVAITVADDGPGFDASVRRHLFDPYFSGRAAGRGIGMGLSKCWRIVTLHGGRIEVASVAGAGATFTLVLPVSESATESNSPQSSPATGGG